MAALRKTQRVLSGLSLIGNFIEKPLRLGDIVLNDDGQHKVWGNIQDLIPGLSLVDKTETSNTADLKCTVESNVSVGIGANGNAKVASGEISLKFNSRNSAFISLKDVTTTVVKLGLVNDQLAQYWREKGFDKPGNRRKYHFISDVITAASGTIIFSEEKNNTIVLKGKTDTPLTSVGVVGSGAVEFVSNSKATLEIISEKQFQPLYSAVRYRANGNFEIVN